MRGDEHLEVVGWGPFRLPGENRRIRRSNEQARLLAEREADDLRRVRTDEGRQSPATNAADFASTRPLGWRKLYMSPGHTIQGADVLELQQQLRALGYDEIGEPDGVFGPNTKQALVRFQNDYGIFTDGVCAQVTISVLERLRGLGVTADHPASDQEKRAIYWAVSRQHSGMVVVDRAYRDPRDRLKERDEFLELLKNHVEEEIEARNQMQTLAPLQSDYSAAERTAFANNIKAELVILLHARQDEGPAGIATFYFSKARVRSDIGAPLANYIREELILETAAADLGSHGEDSELLESASAPTVRVEVGNLGHAVDRERLLGSDSLATLARGIAQGIARVYLLGARPTAAGTAPIGGFSRREQSN